MQTPHMHANLECDTLEGQMFEFWAVVHDCSCALDTAVGAFATQLSKAARTHARLTLLALWAGNDGVARVMNYAMNIRAI